MAPIPRDIFVRDNPTHTYASDIVFATPVKQQDISVLHDLVWAHQPTIFIGFNHHWTFIGPNKSSYKQDVSNPTMTCWLYPQLLLFARWYPNYWLILGSFLPIADCTPTVLLLSPFATGPTDEFHVFITGIFILPSYCQWEFQDPKMEVPTIYKAYIRPM